MPLALPIYSDVLSLRRPELVEGSKGLSRGKAERAGCDYLVTCDDRLVRQGQQLKAEGVLTVVVINPVDLLWEE